MARNFKNWLDAYVTYTAFSEAPEALHFWCGVSSIAGALQRKVWIDQRYFQWTPNFYIVFVAPPGIATKSTTTRIGLDLLSQVEDVNFGPNSLTWQALVDALQKSEQIIPYTPKDADVADPIVQSAITCVVSELGTLIDPSDRKMVDVFTDLWDGQKVEWGHGTKMSGHTKITNPWLNIITATTPAWLKANFPEEMVGGGLASRILWVYAEKKSKYVAYPGDQVDEGAFNSLRDKLIEDLKQISYLAGPMELSPNAKKWGEAWYQDHWDNRPKHLSSQRFGGYVARKQTHIHKTAIVISAAFGDSLVITESMLRAASEIVEHLEQDMIKVFESIGLTESKRNLMDIIYHLRGNGRSMDLVELFSLCFASMEKQAFDDALGGGLKAGYITTTGQGSRILVQLTKKSDSL